MPKELIKDPVWTEYLDEKNGIVWRWQVGTYTIIDLTSRNYGFKVEVRSRHDKATNLNNLQTLLDPIVEKNNTFGYVDRIDVQESIVEAVLCMVNLPPDIEKATTEY